MNRDGLIIIPEPAAESKTPPSAPFLFLGFLLCRPLELLLAGQVRRLLLRITLAPLGKRLGAFQFFRLVPLVLGPKSRLAGLDFFR